MWLEGWAPNPVEVVKGTGVLSSHEATKASG